MTDRYDVEVGKDDLVFSAAHFITFNTNICERLHGHNYRVRTKVSGRLDENQYVVDFIFLHGALKRIIGELDHRVLLPTAHPRIRVHQQGAEVVAEFEDRRWVFPLEDCCLLPVANTTAELLAGYLLDRLLTECGPERLSGLTMASVSVEENFGQWATIERTLGEAG